MLKGRKFIIILLLGITGLILLSSVAVPIQFSSKAKVPYSLDRTMDQFRSDTQLNKWFLKSEQEDKVELMEAKPGTVKLLVETQELQKKYTFHISADPQNRKHCIVDLSMYRTIWKRWFDPDPTDELVVASLKELEVFTNDTQRFYGYVISKEPITDSCYLFMTAQVTDSTKTTVTRQLFDSLIQYIQTQKQEWKGRRIYYEQAGDSSNFTIFTGAVVSCSVETNAALGIGRKTLPAGNQRLSVLYEGPYKNIRLVYKALDQYRKDYSLVGLRLPFEDFLSPGYGYAPDELVRIKVCYPILQ